MIDLAPHNPYSLVLTSPVIIAPGCAGVGVPRDLDPALIGAIATRTAVRTARSDRSLRWAVVPAGVIFEQLPTVGFRALLKDESRRWARANVPVLLSLHGSPSDLIDMLAPLESIDGVVGIVLRSDPIDLVAAIAETRAITPLPLLVMVPPRDDLAVLAREAVAAGADALIVCEYPRGTTVQRGAALDGVIVGPALVPATLRYIAAVAEKVDVPIVAHGGIANAAIAQQCLDLGATAVMIDGALYGDPDAPQRIAMTLRTAANEAANT